MARTRRPAPTPRVSFRPGVEQLEDRTVPSSVDVTVAKTFLSPTTLAVFSGDRVSYQVVVTNTSTTAAAQSVNFNDVLPPSLSNVIWTSTASGTGVTGNSSNTSGSTNTINDTLALPAGTSVTYLVAGDLSGTATGILSNTATATVGGGDTDPDTANNTSTVSKAIVKPTTDVGVTMTDLVDAVAPGQSVSYAVVVTNNGTTDLTTAGGKAVTFTDVLPTNLTNITFTSTAAGGATGNTPVGSISGGNLTNTLDLPAGASVIYRITGQVIDAAVPNADTVVNQATVATSATEDVTTNNSAADADAVRPLDLQVTKAANNSANVTPGQALTYTVTVVNPLGDADVIGAIFTETLPGAANLTNVSYTSTATGGATGNQGGSGPAVGVPSGTNFANALNLPAGSVVTYTITGTVPTTAASGSTFLNTADIHAPSGNEASPANNTAQVLSNVTNNVDLKVTKTDDSKFAINGQDSTYTITVTNIGGTVATDAQVSDALPAEFTSASWTRAASTMGSVGTASGTGSIADTLASLLPGESVTYTLKAAVSTSARGSLTNTASVALPSYLTDVTPANLTSSDRDTILPRPLPAYFNQYAVGADLGAGGHVKVYAPDGTERFSFLAFAGYNGGVRVAAGDVNGDGVNDIVVAAGFGSADGHVKVFDGVDGHEIASFLTFPDFLGGTYVAVGDVNKDGYGDIIVGSGFGVGHVKVFSLAPTATTDFGTPQELYSYFAYPGFLGGITVAAGDVNGDGYADIITGTEEAGHLKVFSVASGSPVEIFSQIVAPNYFGGIDVAAADLRGDGRAEFLFAPMAVTTGFTGQVNVYSIDGTAPIATFTPSLAGPVEGLRVGVGDVDNNGTNDILVTTAPGRFAAVQAYDATTLGLLKEFTAFDDFLGGVYVSST